MAMRVATIDIGTNAVLLLVAAPQPHGGLRAVVERATITRLGEGVDRTRTLSPEAVSRTLACLEGYAELVGELDVGRIAIVGTSAMRDAHGAGELRASIRALFGVEVRVLSGIEEARMSFSGAVDGLDVRAGAETAVFDIGGGSTEVVFGRSSESQPALSYAESFDVGSVRLTERHVVRDPPTESELLALAGGASAAFARVPQLPPGSIPVGVAGTMTTLAAIAFAIAPYDGARVHGTVLQRERLRQVVSSLASLDVSSRRSVPGMEPKRADVIVAGGYIALALVDHWQVDAVRVSDRGLRWGLAYELLKAGSE
jgi:exopolyphosphatase/guanosine-5'-triphosphate,3'-diphosphate pyrophosphatase